MIVIQIKDFISHPWQQANEIRSSINDCNRLSTVACKVNKLIDIEISVNDQPILLHVNVYCDNTVASKDKHISPLKHIIMRRSDS